MNLFLLASRKCSMSFCLMEQQGNKNEEKVGKQSQSRSWPQHPGGAAPWDQQNL